MRRPRRGFFLVLALLVIVVATLSVYSFSGMMIAYDDASYLGGDLVRARVAAESGAESIRLMLSQPPITRDDSGGVFNNPNYFQAIPVSNQDASNVCNFSVLAPNLNSEGQLSGIRFGLQDESARLNLNTLVAIDDNSEGLMTAIGLLAGDDASAIESSGSLATDLLLALPGMSEELADCIMDWLDEDDEQRPFGAEVDFYSTLPTPYEPANGQLQSVEELLLVNGMTPQLLFGADANRNGVLDPDEQQRYGVSVDSVGALGLAAYLTVHSREVNKTFDGALRTNVNNSDLEVLYEDLVAALENEDYASFICAYRIAGQASQLAGITGQNDNVASQVNSQDGGVWTADLLSNFDLSGGGGTDLTQVIDLIDATVSVEVDGRQISYRSPFDVLSAPAYLPLIMDRLTTSDAPTMPGRINVNECPAELLYGNPFLDEEQVQLILETRGGDTDDENRFFETWLMVEGIVTLDQMRNLLPLLTGGGDVYRAQVVGYFETSGLSHRQEVIIDATTVNPKYVSFRDLSHLGRAFDLSVLGIRNSTTVLTSQ
ncbi:MAG: type II secretion system protein GspK [Planctomycetota bacterium]